MKNTEYSLIFLVASLLIAINTDWCVPSKVLVVSSALTLAVNALRKMTSRNEEK